MNFGTTAEASESQAYLVRNFGADALPSEDAPISETGGNGGARRLAALQATMSRLIGGQPATVPARRRQNVRRRPNVRVQAESEMDIETVATVPRPQKRCAEEEEPMRHAGSRKRSSPGFIHPVIAATAAGRGAELHWTP
ncbi:hypothetical protein R3P38DRAFT_2775723 [Favolaschia claudopus]|uniref:Uncharacterized protein n=1 Tax=Favolaschia claudopus TaxID=2862362 RepID=A0AAW0BRB7_9AGAR